MTGVEQRECERFTGLLDTYLDRELPVEEMALISSHLAHCVRCSQERSSRLEFRERLRRAARSVPVPDGLASRSVLHAYTEKPSLYRNPWLMAIAAAIVLSVSTAAYRLGPSSRPPASPESFIAAVSAETPGIMRAGLNDHVHCAVFRKFPDSPPVLTEMLAKLGPAYADLLSVMQAGAPAGMRVVLAHKCQYRGRQYVHLVARSGARLVSLVIAKRSDGEVFENNLRAVVTGSGTFLYSTAVREYAIAGFATAGHLVYVVSGMDQRQNLGVLQAMEPRIRQILSRTEA
jgi:hypothetical protein